MGDATARLYLLEHPLTMVIALVLLTVGYSRAKRTVGTGKSFKSIAVFHGIALLLILVRIPWRPGN